MTVELLNWPDERERRAVLKQANQRCLLLISGDGPPPSAVGPLEDWIRLPSDHRDLEARVASLANRARPAPPSLDEDGILQTSAGSVIIPDIEARILQTMLDHFTRVTDLERLMEAGWPKQKPSRNLFDVHLHRLRRRIAPVDLEIKTVRKRGWILQSSRS